MTDTETFNPLLIVLPTIILLAIFIAINKKNLPIQNPPATQQNQQYNPKEPQTKANL